MKNVLLRYFSMKFIYCEVINLNSNPPLLKTNIEIGNENREILPNFDESSSKNNVGTSQIEGGTARRRHRLCSSNATDTVESTTGR